MICAKIAIALVGQVLSTWSVLTLHVATPVYVCEYRVGDVPYKERQFGYCTAQPKRVPRHVYELAHHNACFGR